MSFKVGDKVLYRKNFPATVTEKDRYGYVISFNDPPAEFLSGVKGIDKYWPQTSKIMQSVMESDLTKQSGGKRKTRSKSKKTRKASRKQRKGTYRKRR